MRSHRDRRFDPAERRREAEPEDSAGDAAARSQRSRSPIGSGAGFARQRGVLEAAPVRTRSRSDSLVITATDENVGEEAEEEKEEHGKDPERSNVSENIDNRGRIVSPARG